MGQGVSKTAAGLAQLEAAKEAKEAMRAYQLLWHGCPLQKGINMQTVPSAPLYDSDDETTDTAVISALAMTDPDEMTPSPWQGQERGPASTLISVHAPFLQSLLLPSKSAGMDVIVPPKLPSPQQHPAHNSLAGAAEGQSGAQPLGRTASSNSNSSSSSSSQHRRLRWKDTTMTAAAAAAAVATAARQHSSVGRSRTAPKLQQQQQQGKPRSSKMVVSLSAAALDAVGAPCRIGGDLPPESLQSIQGSKADVNAVRPYHHLHMMKLHKQQQQQMQQAVYAQVQAQAVWGWHVASPAVSAPQVAT